MLVEGAESIEWPPVWRSTEMSARGRTTLARKWASISENVPRELPGKQRFMSRLSHPYVLPILSAFTHAESSSGETRGYTVTPLVEGGDFSQWCERYRDKNQQHQVMRVFHNLLEALQHLHQNGVINSDVKPQNVLIAKYGRNLTRNLP